MDKARWPPRPSYTYPHADLDTGKGMKGSTSALDLLSLGNCRTAIHHFAVVAAFIFSKAHIGNGHREAAGPLYTTS